MRPSSSTFELRLRAEAAFAACIAPYTVCMRGPTRRELAGLLTALPLAAQSDPPTQKHPPTAAQPSSAAADSLAKANDEVRQTGEKLRAIDVPMDLEPAFQFKA